MRLQPLRARLYAFLERSPDSATAEGIWRFRVHQAASRVQPPTVNGSVPALHP